MNEHVELLSQLIKNKCVNTGEIDSGNEFKNADLIETLFSNYSENVQVERLSKVKNRDNLVVRLEGSDDDAPSLLLLGHSDVVPSGVANWDFDPFGGEVIDGYVCGRGAIDMLNLTSSMALAIKELIDEGFKPKGDLVFACVADEENGGKLGAEYLLNEFSDLVNCDYVLTESGGTQMRYGEEIFLPIVVGEKGVHWVELNVTGVATHGSKPFGANNALLNTNEIINRFRQYVSPLSFTKDWDIFLKALGIENELAEKLANKDQHDEAIEQVEQPLAAVLHSCCHNSISPNMISGGNKINTVPDQVKLGIDIRSLPNINKSDVEKMIEDALGDIASSVSINFLQHEESTISSIDNVFFDILGEVSASIIGNSRLLPTVASYATDARFFRRKGSIAYGFGMFSDKISYVEHLNMFHSANERVDIESLALTKKMYKMTIKKLLG